MTKRIAIIFSCGVLIGACGSSSSTQTRNTAKGFSNALEFSKCMRSHGVSNFPDPSSSGGGVQLAIGPNSGVDMQSPAFQSAQTACQHLMPGGGPGSGRRSAQAHAEMLQTSECMRRHGLTSFPDPLSGSPPSNPAGYSAIIGHGGYFLAIPNSVDINSPAFRQAASACKFGPRGRAPLPAGG